MRVLVRGVVAVACCCFLVLTAHAQSDWPNRAVRIIVPAPAGGPYDRVMRQVAQRMAQTLGQPVVIDNRPSAGNIVGTRAGAAAAPDGYTLTMTGMLNTIAQGMYDKVPFDIVKDFEHVGAIAEGAQWLLVRSDSGINTFQDLLQKAERAPGKLDYASSGAGSAGYLVMELLQRVANVRFTHVPYRGAAPALHDVLAGVVSVIVIPTNAAAEPVHAGKLKVLAVSSERRSAQLPDVPTFTELGFPQLTVTSWVGLSAPKGTPPAIVTKVNAAIRAALTDDALLKRLEFEGLTPIAMSPQEYTELVRSDTQRWGQLVRRLNLRAK
jgi:tripartite-type tricarboxylate transporter receptor subunit TctC